MPTGIPIFGPVHLAILAAVPLFAALLAMLHWRLPSSGRSIRGGLSILLVVSFASYYGSFAAHGVRMIPNHLPLELCDFSLWLVIAALLTLKPAIFDLAYYWALAGASMSLLTPNMSHPSLFVAIQFFADHGLIVAATLYLVWSGQARPRRGSVLRAMVALNVLAAVVGTFDNVFKTDYMFLRTKPSTVSLLDMLGPWPWYILSLEAVGFGLFLLLYLPFRHAGSAAVSLEDCQEETAAQVSTSA
ncbi:MAG: TIGR02206 family membrane protein [Terracidiphilus sp.]